MNAIEIRRLVHRVVGGKEGFPPLTFPHDPRAIHLLVRQTEVFITIAGALTHAQRVRYVRKAAVYIIRHGLSARITFDLIDGTIWFERHPQQLTGRISFGGAVRLQQRQFKTDTKNRQRDSTDAMAHAMATPVPPMPVVLTGEDFLLQRCIHPEHILNTGLEANNCLAFRNEFHALPNARYWIPINKGKGHLFTIRHKQRLVAVFFISGNVVMEMQTFRPPQDFFLILPQCALAVEDLIGPVKPLHDGIHWPHQPEPDPTPHPHQLTFFSGDRP